MACEARIVRVLRALEYPKLAALEETTSTTLDNRPDELARIVSWLEDRKVREEEASEQTDSKESVSRVASAWIYAEYSINYYTDESSRARERRKPITEKGGWMMTRVPSNENDIVYQVLSTTEVAPRVGWRFPLCFGWSCRDERGPAGRGPTIFAHQ